MKKLLLIIPITLSVLLATAHSRVSYDGFKVYRVHVGDQEEADVVSSVSDRLNLDVWKHSKEHFDVMAGPSAQREVERALSENGLNHRVMVEDVQSLIGETARATTEKKERFSGRAHNMDWDTYHSLEEIYEYIDFIAESFSDYVSQEVIGNTWEGREQKLLKICRGGCGDKPAMYLHGGTHAREWVSPATVAYFVNELTVNLTPENEDLIEQLDWYILIVHNPDGYDYSWTTDRLWRKTRSVRDPYSCDGVDPNRNYGEGWGTGGSSTISCSDAFMGPSPFSEFETSNTRDFINARKDRIVFFNDIHSYSQFIMYPWGHLPEDNPYIEDTMRVAEKGNEALFATHGSVYIINSIYNFFGAASGGSIDWTMGGAGIKYSFGMELRDTGEHGFLLPEDQILPTAEEAWAWHFTAAREIAAEYSNMK